MTTLNHPNIPREIFAPMKSGGSFYPIKPYAQTAAVIEVLTDTLEEWRISPYRLSRLLGMTSPSLPYKWVSGAAKPSQFYCILLLRLYQEVLFRKLNITLVDRIDWLAGEIIYKGRGTAQGQLAGSLKRGAMAAFYSKLP